MIGFDEFKEACFRAAKELGCDEAELYAVSDRSFSVNVLDGEIEKYSVAGNTGVNLRVMFNGKNGYAYTEAFEDAQGLAAHAVDNAKVIENDDVHPMQGACSYPEIEKKPNPIVDLTEEEKINIALNLEVDTKAFDDRVNRLSHCSVVTGVSEVHIHNTRGLRADSEDRYSYAVVSPILRQGEDEHSGFAFKFGPDITDYNSIIKESVDNALMEFNAKTVDSGEYRILLRNDAAAELLQAFCGVFFAERVQKGLSLLAGRLNGRIAGEAVSVVDDPFEADNPRAFDDEGVPSVLTNVIENGILKSYLYNLKSALKDGVSSTSNAGRAGAAAPVGTAPSNFYIVKGEKSYKELITELNSGLIITSLDGLHAGLNTVSGDFSLMARGLLVDCGSIIRSVDQITVAGNFLVLMQGILCVGSDLKFGIPGGGRVGSPSLLIDKLVISGK